MEIFDALTKEDKETIKDYISIYAGTEIVNLHITLNEWNQSKKTLYKALGNNLRVKIPIEIKKADADFYRELSEVYHQVFPRYTTNYNYYYLDSIFKADIKKKNNKKLNLVEDLVLFLDNLNCNNKINLNDIFCILSLFCYNNIKNGYIKKLPAIAIGNKYCFKFNNKKMTIECGQKIIKTIQKVLNFYGYDMSNGLFEEFRNKVSNITTSSNIKSNLVFSIHPIDFMTMSDNNCEWSSCMSWMSNGLYSNGTIEMMNSNMVVVAYLESSNPFTVNNHNIPNKSWRTLFYVHKNILVAGKSYPYYNDKLDKTALKELYNLVNKNLKWDYKYKEQEYKDLYSYIPKNEDQININWVKNKQIVIVTGHAMYNDLIEDKDGCYLCYRNIPKKGLVLNASGKNTCLICGLQNRFTTSEKVCDCCKEKYHCDECYNTNPNEKHYDVLTVSQETYKPHRERICEHCINDFKLNTVNHFAIKKGTKPIKLLFFKDGQADKLKDIINTIRILPPSFVNISAILPNDNYKNLFYETIRKSDIEYVEYSVYFNFSYMFNLQTLSTPNREIFTYLVNDDYVKEIIENKYCPSLGYVPLKDYLEQEGLLESSNSIQIVQ